MSPARDVSKFRFPTFARADSPAIKRGNERARIPTVQPREDAMRRLFLILCLLLPVTALGSSASLAQTKLDASILSYDGKDFVRTETTLMKDGQPAINTKLDPDSAAYKALVEKSPTPGR